MPLKINQIYSQEDIKNMLDCTIMRGMNYKINTNRLILIRNHVKSIYDDRQDGNILYYTGEGTKGDQELKFSNKRLSDSNKDNTEVLLFEVFKIKEYTYKGQVKLIDEPYQEFQSDSEGLNRKVYIFPLEILNDEALINDENILQNNNEQKQKKTKKLSDIELNKRVIETEKQKPGYSYTKIKVYQRSEYIVESVLRRANGICELCESTAPFLKKDGTHYLEVHHIDQLAKGGADTVENAVALCPNCHRKMHSLNLENDIRKLKSIKNKFSFI